MPASAVKLAKDAMFVDTAVDQWLTRLGANYGVARPAADPKNDALYSQMIQLCGLQPKVIKRITLQMLEVIFGTQADIVAAGGRAWQCYEPSPNKLTVEIPHALVAGSTSNATYLHGLGGRDGYTAAGAGATDTLLVARSEDFTRASASLVGLTLVVSGSLYTILSVAYDGVGLNTIRITAASLSLGATDLVWSIRIPSSGSVPGSYLVADSSTPGSTVGNRPVILYGPARIDIFKQYMLNLVKAAGVILVVETVNDPYVHPPGNPLTH